MTLFNKHKQTKKQIKKDSEESNKLFAQYTVKILKK